MNKRTTNYKDEEILVICDTYFHSYKLGEKVRVINSDLYSYHVVSVSGDKKHCWVDEAQVRREGEYIKFKTETGIEAGYRFDEDGEVRIKIFSSIPKSHYYSALNEAGAYYDEHLLHIVNRKHVSQLKNQLTPTK